MKPETEPSTAPRNSTFVLSAALAIALLTTLLGFYVFSERQTAIADGRLIATQNAHFTALATEGTLESSRHLLRSMAILARQHPQSKAASAGEIRRTLLDWRQSDRYIMDLLIVDRQGRILHWTGPGTPPDVSDRPYFLAHLKGSRDTLHLGEPLLSKVHFGQWFFAMSQAVRDADGDLDRVVVAILDIELLRNRLNLGGALAGSSQALVSNEGVVYVRIPDHGKFVGKRVSRAAEFSSLTDSSPDLVIESESQLDGQQRILAFHKVKGYPLVAVGTVELSAMLKDWVRQALAAATLWALLAIGIVWTAIRLHHERKVLADLASIDGLTGIPNRRSILDAASRLERSQVHAGALSLLMIDADHFKAINDRFGHAVGDEVLRQLSEVLKRNVRTSDIVGRYGGEEFLVLMPDTGEDGALRVAEKLRAAVEEQVRLPVPLTISVGVATTRERDLSLDRTLVHADAALYAAKAAGRNCVRVDREHTAS